MNKWLKNGILRFDFTDVAFGSREGANCLQFGASLYFSYKLLSKVS